MKYERGLALLGILVISAVVAILLTMFMEKAWLDTKIRHNLRSELHLALQHKHVAESVVANLLAMPSDAAKTLPCETHICNFSDIDSLQLWQNFTEAPAGLVVNYFSQWRDFMPESLDFAEINGKNIYQLIIKLGDKGGGEKHLLQATYQQGLQDSISLAEVEAEIFALPETFSISANPGSVTSGPGCNGVSNYRSRLEGDLLHSYTDFCAMQLSAMNYQINPSGLLSVTDQATGMLVSDYFLPTSASPYTLIVRDIYFADTWHRVLIAFSDQHIFLFDLNYAVYGLMQPLWQHDLGVGRILSCKIFRSEGGDWHLLIALAEAPAKLNIYSLATGVLQKQVSMPSGVALSLHICLPDIYGNLTVPAAFVTDQFGHIWKITLSADINSWRLQEPPVFAAGVAISSALIPVLGKNGDDSWLLFSTHSGIFGLKISNSQQLMLTPMDLTKLSMVQTDLSQLNFSYGWFLSFAGNSSVTDVRYSDGNLTWLLQNNLHKLQILPLHKSGLQRVRRMR